MSKKRSEKKRKGKEKFVLRCPICFSDRNDLWLGGKGGLQMRKCLDCGYIGATFIEVEQKWSPPPQKKGEKNRRAREYGEKREESEFMA